jgi:hypothetical protein
MFIYAIFCLFIFRLHLGHSKICPSWVFTTYPHLGHSLEVFSGGTKAVNAISDILLCMLLQGVLEFLFLLDFSAFFVLAR